MSGVGVSAEGVLGWLAVTSLAATALLGVVLVCRTLARRAFGARAAAALWAMPALRLVLPPLGLGILVWPTRDEAPAVAAVDVPTSADVPVTPTFVPSGLPVPVETAPALPALPSLSVLLLVLWAVGAAAALALCWLRSDLWRRTLLAEAEAETPPALTGLMRDAARMAGCARTPRLIVSGAAASPQVIGARRPLVAVPPGFAQDYAPDEQRLALLHEATHVARGDLWTLAAAEALIALHWFNPALRLARPRLRADLEAACDEAVRARGVSAPDYAGTLLRAARGPSGAPAVPALTLNHDLKRRIETMRDPLPSPARTTLGAALLCGASLLVAAATQARPDAQPQGAADDQSEDSSYSYAYASTDDEMVLLGDPFAGLSEAVPAAPEGPAAPIPPVPPAAPGEGFEAQMEAWGESMGEWGEAFGDSYGAYGEAMGAWGERMGAIGEAVGALAEDCEDHRERTEAPTILSVMMTEESNQLVRAVCARGGRERYASAELARFVRDARELSEEEAASYMARVAEMRRGGSAERWSWSRSEDAESQDGDEAAPANALTEPFTEIRASSGTSVTDRPGGEHTVRLDERARERTTYTVQDGVLSVRCLERRGRCPRGDRGEVTVTMPTLTALSASSGAAVAVDGDVATPEGLNLEASSIEVSERQMPLQLDASSGGAVDARDVRATDVEADASSGGSIRLFASGTLDAEASSGGAISHRGGAVVRARESSGGSVSGR